MTNEELSKPLAPSYKRFATLHDIAKGNDMLADYVLAGCPASKLPELLKEFWLRNEYVHDLKEYANMEDLWSEYEYDVIAENEPSHDSFGWDAYYGEVEKDLDVFTKRVAALSKVLEAQIEKRNA